MEAMREMRVQARELGEETRGQTGELRQEMNDHARELRGGSGRSWRSSRYPPAATVTGCGQLQFLGDLLYLGTGDGKVEAKSRPEEHEPRTARRPSSCYSARE